jgi:hypothetical protein
MPPVSARVRVAFHEPALAAEPRPYALRGSAEEIAGEVRKFADVGVEHLALLFAGPSPGEYVQQAERFAAEVQPLA